MDVQMDYTLNPLKIPALYKTFRKDIGDIEIDFFAATIKSALNKTVGQDSLSKLMGPDKERIRKETQDFVQSNLEPYGVQIRQFTITGVRPDKAILQAISEQNQAKTKALAALNQLEQTRALAEGRVIDARADSPVNKLKAESATPRTIQMQMLEKWDGRLPVYIGGNQPIPFLNISGGN
jgi:regulator of protease activity HflC (stomatin/prohibitin superfamily)